MTTGNGNGNEGNGNENNTVNPSGGRFSRIGGTVRNFGSSAFGKVKSTSGYVGRGLGKAGSYARNNPKKAVVYGALGLIVASGITYAALTGLNRTNDPGDGGTAVSTEVTPTPGSLEDKVVPAVVPPTRTPTPVADPTAMPYVAPTEVADPTAMPYVAPTEVADPTAMPYVAPTRVPDPTATPYVAPVVVSTSTPVRPTITPTPAYQWQWPSKFTLDKEGFKDLAKYACLQPALGLSEDDTLPKLFDGVSDVKRNSEALRLNYSKPDNKVVIDVEHFGKEYSVTVIPKENGVKSLDLLEKCIQESWTANQQREYLN